MAEYIEKEAAIEAAKHAWAKGIEPSQYIDIIPAAVVAPAKKWIPVTERLPEEEGLYLVAVVNDHERRYSKTAWYHGHGNWFLHQKVTNWMPLPEPPKEE